MAKTPLTHSHHVVPLSTYFFTLIALLVLMFATVAISQIDLPGIWFLSGHMVNNLVAVGIATVKAVLVIMIFMGVYWSSSLTKLWVVLGFVCASLMTIIYFDYATRGYEPTRPWDKGGDTALPREHNPNTQIPTDETQINVRPRQ